MCSAEKSAHDVPWGTGTGGAKAMMQEYQRQNAKITFLIEYEHFTPGLVQDVGAQREVLRRNLRTACGGEEVSSPSPYPVPGVPGRGD